MRTEPLILLGAGGHACVVVDALLCLGWDPANISVQDDRRELDGTQLLGCVVHSPVRPVDRASAWVHAAVGQASVRARLLGQSAVASDRWMTVSHPRAVIARSAGVGVGSFVAAMAVLGPCAIVGRGSIINHGAVIDHDCEVGDYCHVGPNATLGGAVRIGNGATVGAGATVLPGVCIGENAVIAAGAVVVHDVPSGQTVAGIPARNLSKGN